MAKKRSKKKVKKVDRPVAAAEREEDVVQTSATETMAGDQSDESRSEPSADGIPPSGNDESEEGERDGAVQGVLALFEDPDTILDAARKTGKKGYKKWDVFTPFPVHGMDEAMGLGRSKIPWITFAAGAFGTCAAIFIQFGAMVFSWPQIHGGKPHAAWPSFVPITFEMTVFCAGVTTALAALFMGGVFRFKKPKLDRDITSHRFAIFIEAGDPKFDQDDSRELLAGLGAVEVRLVREGQ